MGWILLPQNSLWARQRNPELSSVQYSLERQRGQQAAIFNTHLEGPSHIFKAIYVMRPVLFGRVTAMEHDLRTVQRIPSWIHWGALYYLLTTSLIPDKIYILVLWARPWILTIHFVGSLWPYSSFNPNLVVFCCISTEIPPLCKVLEADKRVVQLVSISCNYLQTSFAMPLLQWGPLAHLWLLSLVGLPWHSCPHLGWLHTSEGQVTLPPQPPWSLLPFTPHSHGSRVNKPFLTAPPSLAATASQFSSTVIFLQKIG